MAKTSKAVKGKKPANTHQSTIALLKKEFKAKLSELSKQFDKQLVAAKKSAQAKALKDTQEAFTKHAKAKEKAVKDAVKHIDQTRDAKVKATTKKTLKPVKTATAKKPTKVAKPKKAMVKKSISSKRTLKS